MAKKKVEKTKEEILNETKKAAWESFKELKFDALTAEQRESHARDLYETLATYPAPPTVDIPYDFWKQYEASDEIKEINRFKVRVDSTLTTIPKNPTKESWLDRERGIVPSLKREWKERVEPFKNERILREQVKENVRDFFNLPENKDKKMSVDVGKSIEQALENIEETLYRPTRAKIEQIESEIKKRVS